MRAHISTVYPGLLSMSDFDEMSLSEMKDWIGYAEEAVEFRAALAGLSAQGD